MTTCRLPSASARLFSFTASGITLSLCLLASLGLGRPAEAAEQPSVASIRSVEVTVSPLVPRTTAGGEANVLLATLDSDGLEKGTIRLSSAAWPGTVEQGVENLAKGKQTVRVRVPALTAAASVRIAVEAGGQSREFGPFTVEPARRWTVYLTQHTHTDIGYTRPQTEILPEHLRYIDYALDYCDLTDALPDDARFRWTCETSWAVREYLKGRPAAQIERLKRRVSEGRIELCGLLLNMSEIASESSLAALLRPVRAIKEEFGIPIRTAMQNDVNGAGWCLADYFPDLGIRYLTMGINRTRSILPFDLPTAFWWESPSGRRVLAYRSDHYMTANFWGLEKGDRPKVQSSVEDYLRSLEQRAYPFDRIGVQFSGYFTDNSPPSTAACEVVKAWNEQFAAPRLRLSTAQEFLSWVEREQADKLAVHRQAWPDWWTDGFGSAARETAAARETETATQINHGLLAMASLLGAEVLPATLARAAAIQDNLLFYEEHTFGAAESISDPLAENAQVQWGEKMSYVWSAVKDSNLLREEAFGLVQDFLPRADVPSLAVFNTLNWARSGLVRVFIDHEILPPDREFQILDGDQVVLAQPMERRSEGAYWALWVNEVPALGYKMLRVETTDQPRTSAEEDGDALTLENRFYRLTLDPERGAIASLFDKATGEEMVDTGADWALGQCIYETMPGNRDMKPDVFKRTSVREVQVRRGASGPIWQSLIVKADLDGCAEGRGLETEIRMYEPEKRIELHYTLRKEPVRTPEAVYVAFPFRAPDSRMLYEAQGGLVTPGVDQIPGSSSDWQTLQSFLAVRRPGGQIILGSEQAPLVQLGDFNLGKWQPVTKVEKPHVYSWVMNNYWFTNFRAEQEGDFRWHYYLTSTGDLSRVTATQFGWGSRVPLVTRVFLPGSKSAPRPRSLSALALAAPNVLVVEARPARDGNGVFLHLREVEGKPVTLTGNDLACAVAEIRRADEVNVLGETLQEGIESLSLPAHGVKFVVLTLR